MAFSDPLSKRLLLLTMVGTLVAAPALALRATCAGNSCKGARAAQATVPFCSLPGELRDRVADGFYEGRSPDLIVISDADIAGDTTGRSHAVPWPSLNSPEPHVPIVFAGTGIAAGTRLPGGTGLDDIAPTLARVIDLHRPNPDVRSGEAIAGVASGETPRLVVQVVWKHLSSRALERAPGSWPTLAALMDEGAGTLSGRIGSVPVDPVPVLATIGTGGLPRQHGIVGPVFRNNLGYARTGARRTVPVGAVVKAWGPRSPGSAIAALADDLANRPEGNPKIGLVATEVADRGLLGGGWYSAADTFQTSIVRNLSPEVQRRAAIRMMRGEDFGRDDTPDLLAIAAEGSIRALDAQLRSIVAAAREVSGDSVAVVVTATGDRPGERKAAGVERLLRAATGAVVTDAVPGGLFLDQQKMATERLSEDRVIHGLLQARDRRGQRLVADAFAGLAVSFERYC